MEVDPDKAGTDAGIGRDSFGHNVFHYGFGFGATAAIESYFERWLVGRHGRGRKEKE